MAIDGIRPRYNGAICLAVVALLVLAHASAQAAMQAYTHVKGQKQGKIESDNKKSKTIPDANKSRLQSTPGSAGMNRK